PFIFLVYDHSNVVRTLSTILDDANTYRAVDFAADRARRRELPFHEQLEAWMQRGASEEILEVAHIKCAPRRQGELGIVCGHPVGSAPRSERLNSLGEAAMGTFIAAAHRENSLSGQLRSL